MPGCAGALATERHAIRLGMTLREEDRCLDAFHRLLHPIFRRATNRRESGRAQPRQGSKLDLSKQRLFVWEMGIEGSNRQTGLSRDQVTVDALCPLTREESETGLEQS